MKFNPFKKTKSENVKKEETSQTITEGFESSGANPSGDVRDDKLIPGKIILKRPYVSERASALLGLNQYVFEIYDNSNKKEVKKLVESLYDVKVKKVRVIKRPGKIRNIGRHSGFKPGFKKAVISLEEGYSINQVKP